MKPKRDTGEPPSRGQVDRRAVEARALREALFAVAFFTGAVLINGILAILFIAFVRALGLWGSAAGDGASLDEIDELRARLNAIVYPAGSQSHDG